MFVPRKFVLKDRRANWAIYRDGELINGREMYSRKEALERATAIHLAESLSEGEKGPVFHIGSYPWDVTYAPKTLKGCTSQKRVGP